jgi:hypothetical protein
MTDHEDNHATPRTDHFLQCLPAGMPAEERLDQLTAHACDLERTLGRVIAQLAQDQADADALRELCGHAAEVIAAGEDLHELEEQLREAGTVDGVSCTEAELLEDAQHFLRYWRFHQETGKGNEQYLRQRRNQFEADCNASGFMAVQMLERAEKLLDRDNAERIQGQQH